MNWEEQYRQIDIALIQQGFRFNRHETNCPTWDGRLEAAGTDISVSVIIPDFDLVKLPVIKILDLDQLPSRNHPHIDPDSRTLCYADANGIVLDRYLPGGMVLRCLEIAGEVLGDIITGKLDKDFPEEFAAYWDGKPVHVDLPSGYAGEAKLRYMRHHEDGKPIPHYTNRTRFTQWHMNGFVNQDTYKYPAPVVDVLSLQNELMVPSSSVWPPNTLKDVLDWLASNHPEISSKFLKAIFKKRSVLRLVGLHAPNGFFVVGVRIPQQWQTEEFMRQRPDSLNKLLEDHQDEINVERYFGARTDKEFLYQRNLGNMKGLADTSILLIGCGTVGGFLSQMLVQSGAGTNSSKRLTLVDHDTLMLPNVGRHLLGVPFVGSNKATACKTFVEEQHPEARVHAVSEKILDVSRLLQGHDLIIDATGEEALSVAINEYLIRMGENAPPVVYLWLEGNGAVGRGLFYQVGEGACYKCLHPHPASEPRFPVLKDDFEIEKVETLSCGDTNHVPFPVSRSLQTAGLGLDMILNFVNGNPKPKLRNRFYDPGVTKFRKDSNPSQPKNPKKKCPACQKTSVSRTQ